MSYLHFLLYYSPVCRHFLAASFTGLDRADHLQKQFAVAADWSEGLVRIPLDVVEGSRLTHDLDQLVDPFTDVVAVTSTEFHFTKEEKIEKKEEKLIGGTVRPSWVVP